MSTLEKRIDNLEQATNTHTNTVVFVRFDEPGEPDRELTGLEGSYSKATYQKWARIDGETEQAFKARACREVKRNPNGVALLFQKD